MKYSDCNETTDTDAILLKCDFQSVTNFESGSGEIMIFTSGLVDDRVLTSCIHLYVLYLF